MHELMKSLKSWARKRPKPLALVILVDILLTAVALNVFALFHHVIPRTYSGIGKVSSRPGMSASAEDLATAGPTVGLTESAAATSAPTVEATVAAAQSATPASADPVGYFGTKFADKFITGEPQTVTGDRTIAYVSENVHIDLWADTFYESTCYIADIYVRDISNLRTGLAKGEYGKGLRDWVKNIAGTEGAVMAVNGDYYGARSTGVVIRNGTLYRDDYSEADVCVLYWDGTLEAYSPGDFDADVAMARGAYQAWCFGPMLLDGAGTPLTDFNTDVGPHNPRTVIGYYEPGHYCLVVVDGRSSKSAGMTMTELASFMSQLGCRQAYNLDGGQTSVMAWGDKVISKPYDGGRKTSDIIMIAE